MKNQKKSKEKKFIFTTYNALNEVVEMYEIEAYNVKEARKYANEIVANSKDNEIRHGRVTLKIA